ncbi:MAG: hypothetical protein WC832_02130 [Anaerolineales bacterium]
MTTTAATPTPTTAKKIFEAIARFSRKAIKFVFKTVQVLLIIAIVLPIGYFAWRAAQPMNAPQFNGLTFHQYMTWRVETYKANGARYQATHPKVKVKPWACIVGDLGYGASVAPLTEYYTLAGIYPGLRRFIDPHDYEYIPANVTWMTFLPAWWDTYEALVWNWAQGDHGRPLAYCRLPQYPPTPEEWAQTH